MILFELESALNIPAHFNLTSGADGDFTLERVLSDAEQSWTRERLPLSDAIGCRVGLKKSFSASCF